MADDISRARPTDRAGGLRPEPPEASQPKALIPRAAPRDPDDEGAVEWIVSKLSERQYLTLRRLSEVPEHQWSYAEEVGAPSTLNSLWDFKRGERECWAPLQLCNSDYSLGDRCNLWRISDLGRRVAASAIKARRAETRSGSVHESAVAKPDVQGGVV